MRTCKTTILPALILVLAVIVQSAAAQPAPVGQQVAKEEVLVLTVPPACTFNFKVIEGKGLNSGSMSMLRGMGYGVKGVPEGTGLPVKCGDVDGSGWIDSDGNLQAFIAPAKGWLFEKSGDAAKKVNGKLHVLTKLVPFDGKSVDASYVVYAGSALGEYALRLIKEIGIGIKGSSSPVLVKLANGQRQKGTLSPSGVLAVLEETWAN